MSEHINDVHVPVENRKKHTCKACGESFAKTSELAIHRHEHNVPPPCPECGVKYQTKIAMKKHLMSALPDHGYSEHDAKAAAGYKRL
jgi:predicted RNA-binding Zn-ribbon protein involved in translation (DUF1610 family)